METKDIIIIGGGAAGLMASCAAAHVLKKRGSVLVLERGNASSEELTPPPATALLVLILNVSPHITTAMLRQSRPIACSPKLFVPCSQARACHQVGWRGQGIPQENQQAAAVLSRFAVGCRKIRRVISEEHTVSKIRKSKRITLICTDGAAFTKQCIFDACAAVQHLAPHSCGEATLAKQLNRTVTKLYRL